MNKLDMSLINTSRRKELRLPNTFRALRHYNYRLWFVGQTVSLIGTWMQTMAQQVLVYRITNSAAALGIVNFVALIPIIPLSFVGGSIVDQFPKRTLIIITNLAMMAQAILFGFLAASPHVQIWHVYILSFLFGAINAIDLPARQAFTVDMVEGKDDLANAIGLNSAMFNSARAIGPALSGIVVAATGESNAFFLNAATFLAVIICLALMRNLPQSSKRREAGHTAITHMAQGMKFVVSNRTIAVLISLIAVSAFLSMPYSTLMPVFADKVLGASAGGLVGQICAPQTGLIHCESPEALTLGLLLTMVGIGAVISALVVASLDSSARRGWYLTLCNFVFPGLLLAFSISKSFIASLVVLFGVGFAFVMQNALANTLLQIISPDELRGRVMGFYTMTLQVTMRLGGLQAGYAADWFSAPVSVGVGAAVSLVYAAYVALKFPSVRALK